MKSIINFTLLALLFISGVFGPLYGTHIRAGEITATLIDCQTYSYQFTITGYTDTGSQVQFGGGEINFGDGTVIRLDTRDFNLKQDLGNEVAINIFLENHTFPGPGTYTITFREFNRNANVVNMDRSVDTPFYIETTIIIDPLLGCNNTPVLTIPPIDGACTNKLFMHNPGAYDVDGDSLSYKLVIPKQNRDQPVANYRYPNDSQFGGTQQDGSTPTLFSLDAETGDLMWNSPGMAGEYNLAFIVEEWRQIGDRWVRLGYVTRDMQVIVDECDNEPPEIFLPEDTCVVAGALVEKDFIAIDPDGDNVKLESFGAVYNLDVSRATYTPFFEINQDPYQGDTAKITFNWQTVCAHVRENPYQVRVKATDDGTPNLASFDTWNIEVVGPAPEGLTATKVTNRSIRISWDDYECDGAATMQIWRRVGSNPFIPDACEIGMREGAGYELINTVPIGQSDFIDDNNGIGLSFGANYCYRLVAVFPSPRGGESIVSEEICEYIEITSPVITNVSVEKTGESDGEIMVKWTTPLEIDGVAFPPPYTYDLYRATGLIGTLGGGSQIASGISENDTIYNDTGLNTLDLAYNYYLELKDANGTLVDTSAVASSVRLELSPQVGFIGLEWQAEVPWSNEATEYPMHLIYRDRVNDSDPGALVLIDSINVLENGFFYLDDGSATNQELNEDDEYCYVIETRGTYGNPIILDPLLNKSQRACAQPNDTIPPCTPIDIAFNDFNSPDECEEFMSQQLCDFNDFTNTLIWSPDLTGDCDDDIRGYNVFFSSTGEDGTFEQIAFTRDTFFIHDNLPSFAGCYQVSAIDRSGNESERSEIICKDNCPQLVFPNVITPNEDGKNDIFRAITNSSEQICPWFVESVTFKVFNRWGAEVYDSERQSNLEQTNFVNWNGETNSGEPVSSGIYYYLAEVTFDVLNPKQKMQEIKGWIHVLDDEAN